MATRPGRRWWNVGATKIPAAERDIAHAVLADPDTVFYDILGADTDDDDPTFPVGADTAYSVYATDDQAARLGDAANLRHLQPDGVLHPVDVPTTRTLDYMGARFSTVDAWHARDVTVAILDQGTTAAVRFAKNWTLVGRRAFSDVPPDEIFPGSIHGCLTSGCGVPYGGRILDGLITDSGGAAPFSAIAAGIRWAGENGAKVINLSFGGIYFVPAVVGDALTYLGGFDCEFYAAAGNDAVNELSYPAAYSRNFTYANSVIAFDETTDARGSFSNWSADASGATAGVLVTGYNPDGTERVWSGTSAAAPHAASLCARLQTGGRLSARQAGAALRANLRDAHRGAQQGGGVFNLERALTGYGVVGAHHGMLAVI